MPRSFPGSSDDVARPATTAPDADRLTVARGTQPEIDLEIRRSHFLARAARTGSEEEARGFISSVRATYPDARHHCSAFIVALPGANPVERSSDDGEPSGTAGVPMLEVLRRRGLTDLVVVVTRYFGGIKLGAGGLIRAYSHTAALGIEASGIQRMTLFCRTAVTISYSLLGTLENELRRQEIRIADKAFAEAVTLTLLLPRETAGQTIAELVDLTASRCEIVPQGEEYLGIPLQAPTADACTK